MSTRRGRKAGVALASPAAFFHNVAGGKETAPARNQGGHLAMSEFLFATGIENSYPTIAGGLRVDEMEKCDHYRRWREDLALVHGLGLSSLRWGPPLYQTFQSPGRYDWSWTDAVVAEMGRLHIEPILDLCHFGVPDWLANFQNADFPAYFAEYAAACAKRYPRIRYWTPVNELLITTLFSAKYGWWNERLTSDAAYVRATLNACRATRLAMTAIRRQVPGAVFVQSESCEYTHAACPEVTEEAAFQNQRRFLPLDLIYGHSLSPRMEAYLRAHGMNDADHAFFMRGADTRNCILGTDYYVLNEHVLRHDGSTGPAGDVLGYYAISRQYYESLWVAFDAYRNEPPRRGGSHRLVIQAMARTASASPRRGSRVWLHLVQPHRPDGLGHGLAGGCPSHRPGGAIRSGAPTSLGGLELPETGAGLEQGSDDSTGHFRGSVTGASARHPDCTNTHTENVTSPWRQSMNEVVRGAVSGFAATVPMTVVMESVWEDLPPQEQQPVYPSIITERVLGAGGIERHMTVEQHRVAALLSHFGYGAAMGAGYGFLRTICPCQPSCAGSCMVWQCMPLVTTGTCQRCGSSRPIAEHPRGRRAMLLAAHVVWGLATVLLAEGMERTDTAMTQESYVRCGRQASSRPDMCS